MWAKSGRLSSLRLLVWLCYWALRWLLSWRRFAAFVLATSLCLLPLRAFAQKSATSTDRSPISNEEIVQMRIDLGMLIAQRNYWKDRSDNYEKAVTMLSARLETLERSLQDSPDPKLLLEEIAGLRKQLADALASSEESKTTLASLDQRISQIQGQLKTAQDTAKDLENERDFWRIAAIVAAAAAAGLGIWAAVK